MADVEISYNGDTIVSMSDSGTEYLDTKGKFMADDVTITYTKSGGGVPNTKTTVYSTPSANSNTITFTNVLVRPIAFTVAAVTTSTSVPITIASPTTSGTRYAVSAVGMMINGNDISASKNSITNIDISFATSIRNNAGEITSYVNPMSAVYDENQQTLTLKTYTYGECYNGYFIKDQKYKLVYMYVS